ncbi:MAG: STM4015 family protein [Planctomycetaceae bacterium]|nr:STM4015 family protein [Planctomycetaceae bacterium]
MSRYDHMSTFGGKPVVLFESGMEIDPEKCYRIAWSWDREDFSFQEMVAEFVGADAAAEVTALVTGAYSEEMYEENMNTVLEPLVAAAGQFPGLTHLFIGDIISEENEISWIQQSDLSPLWTAFPRLRTLGMRGGNGLTLGAIVHDQLRTLIIETGGLSRSVIAEIAAARLPELQHLEIWTGSNGYGADSTVDDVKPLFERSLFPKLKTLAIRNCEYADQLPALAATASILGQLDVLDFSMGAMSDAGADLLLANRQAFASLKKLDLSENMLTAKKLAELKSMPCPVVDAQQREGWVSRDGSVRRYPAVGE